MSAISTITVRTAGGAISTLIVNRGAAGATGETPLITSTTTPGEDDRDAIWFDPETGGFSVWYVDAWVAVAAGGGGGVSTAADVSFSPASGIAATDVQAALVELAGDISNLSGSNTGDETAARITALITTTAHKEAFFAALGVPAFDTLAAANASGAITIGKPFYNRDVAVAGLDITTA